MTSNLIDHKTDVDAELYEALEDVANDTNRTLSQVIRVALRNYLASREPLDNDQ